MKDLVLYIHGRSGRAEESEHYRPLFPDCEVVGLDYVSSTPREAGKEIRKTVEKLKRKYQNIILIANSIGAFFCMNAGIDTMIRRAYFISPVIDMEQLILGMMSQANVTETELRSKGTIYTTFGEDLSWEYLCYVRTHPFSWNAPTQILYGRRDELTSFDTVSSFAETIGAMLTVMEKGEHWFHTEEQMQFLDNWIQGEST